GDASAEDETQSLAGQSEGSDDAELDKQTDDFDSDATTMLDATEDTIVTETADDTAAEEGPRDDVIAEADVYLAYGIYQQAEELLTQAIADHPERDDYRLKLAETHYASKNASAFIGVANEIKSNADGDDNPIWKKVLVMGQDLCPDEIMFQGSMVSGLDVDSMAPKAPEMDFDLGLDSSENNEEAALNLDDDELELPEMDIAEERAEETADVTADDQGGAAAPVDELEFDLSDTGAMQAVPGVEDDFSLDIDATELDIDIQDETEEPVVAESDVVTDVDDIDFGLNEAEDNTTAESDDEEISLDLSEEVAALDLDEAYETETDEAEAPEEIPDEISLDLTDEDVIETVDDSEGQKDADAVADIADVAAVSTDDDDFDLSSLDDVDEISTKLDLARAYLDMGDHEGTREILEEVLTDGNDEQKQEANELMAKLD
ncbi:MAG: hypothetical protein IMF14_07400, partial [Proteobacteria bacterium]|nr:hypothetical protein [Pseudomonadota bacterium]